MQYEFFLRKQIYTSFAEPMKRQWAGKKKNQGKENKVTTVPKIQALPTILIRCKGTCQDYQALLKHAKQKELTVSFK